MCSTSSYTHVILNYSRQSGGTAGTLIFWSGMTLCPAGAPLQMTDWYNLFCLYAQVICDLSPPPQPTGVLILCLQFHIVTTTLWGQLAGKTMTVLPRSLLLYCTAMVACVYQTPTFPPHYGDSVKVKSQHICQAIPTLRRGLG